MRVASTACLKKSYGKKKKKDIGDNYFESVLCPLSSRNPHDIVGLRVRGCHNHCCPTVVGSTSYRDFL